MSGDICNARLTCDNHGGGGLETNLVKRETVTISGNFFGGPHPALLGTTGRVFCSLMIRTMLYWGSSFLGPEKYRGGHTHGGA